MTSVPISDHNFAKKTLVDVEIEKCTLVVHGYTEDYVRQLEQELQKLMKENTELKSAKDRNKVSENGQVRDLQIQNQTLTRKINFLILLIREISHSSVNREDILITLKAILDEDFSNFSPSINSNETYIENGTIHQFSQYLSIKHNAHRLRKKA